MISYPIYRYHSISNILSMLPLQCYHLDAVISTLSYQYYHVTRNKLFVVVADALLFPLPIPVQV